MFLFQLSSHSWVVLIIKITIIIFSYVYTCVCDGIYMTSVSMMTWFICRKKAYEWISCLLQCALYNIAVTTMQVCQLIYFLLAMLFPNDVFFGVNVKFMKQKVDENETDCRYGWFSCMFSNIYCDSVEYRDSWTYCQDENIFGNFFKCIWDFLSSILAILIFFNVSILITL